MKVNPSPPLEVLRQYFNYNPDTGDLTWKVHRGGYARKGSLAGALDPDGYLRVRINRIRHRVHRISWCLHYGEEIPENTFIDHINGDRSDNRIENLRVVTSSGNCFNRVKHRLETPETAIGVAKSGNRWKAKVGNTHLGVYETYVEAVAAREAALTERLRNITIPEKRLPSGP